MFGVEIYILQKYAIFSVVHVMCTGEDEISRYEDAGSVVIEAFLLIVTFAEDDTNVSMW